LATLPRQDGYVRLFRLLTKRFLMNEERLSSQIISTMQLVRRLHDVDDYMYRTMESYRSEPSALIRLGFRCNQDCSFCWQDRHWPEPNFEYFEQCVHVFGQRGVRHLTISGGEPTLWPSLPELIEIAIHKYRMNVTVQTNAIQLRRKDLLDRLWDSGLRRLFVSLHSHDAQVSDLMTRAKGTHKNTVVGIQAALEKGMSIGLNAVVERSNLPTLEEYAQYVVRQFCSPDNSGKISDVSFSHPCQYRDQDEWASSLVPLDEVSGPLARAVKIIESSGIAVKLSASCGFPLCVVAESTELIEPIENGSISDSDVRTFPDICKTCAAIDHCVGPRQEYLAHFGVRGLKPFVTNPFR